MSSVFISRVEESIKRAGFITDNIFLSAKLPLKAVIKQIFTEGVKTVVLLEKFYERDRKICIQIIGSNGAIQGNSISNLD